MKKLHLVVLLLITLVTAKLKAQDHPPIIRYQMATPRNGSDASSPVAWNYTTEKVSAHEAIITLTAIIKPGYHIYSQKLKSGGPVKTTITFQPSKEYGLIGLVTEPKPVIAEDKAFKMQVAYFTGKAIFKQKVHFSGKGFLAKGVIEYMAGDDNKNMPPFTTQILVGISSPTNPASSDSSSKSPKVTIKHKKMF